MEGKGGCGVRVRLDRRDASLFLRERAAATPLRLSLDFLEAVLSREMNPPPAPTPTARPVVLTPLERLLELCGELGMEDCRMVGLAGSAMPLE